jgi:hypothetical protein
MAREKKFASPGGAKETPAGRLMDTVIENVIRPRGPVRFLPTEEWLDSFVKDSEVRELRGCLPCESGNGGRIYRSRS